MVSVLGAVHICLITTLENDYNDHAGEGQSGDD